MVGQRQYEEAIQDSDSFRPPQRTWDNDGAELKAAKYSSTGNGNMFIAVADNAGRCGEAGGSLGLRMRQDSDDDDESFVVDDRYATGAMTLPQLLLHLPKTGEWIGLDPGKALFNLGGASVTWPTEDVFMPNTCGC